ncbi:pimeloyl-ACP methyl ester carboxylesterase [Phycicoccus badiiscoriae]|uniref:Pimeloyl-ACP methyl ester carboxylesterase n=1 Tax=Pedococcus badiiscoriae TaxID=642776 RepID=A0A852WB03_9MICO|nr:alpha/beta fold hydrolase [Pedococcus badiiscoriae]NYG06228.1 pimeloyl-ACP methyl ester carboxylesterase [Pedococcus badiiscoriae]
MVTITRRTFVSGTVGAAALATAGCRGSQAPGVEIRTGSLTSRHWAGRDITWRIARPSAGDPALRPIVIVLHGKGGNSSHAFRMLNLQDHVASTRLTVASVDGGDYYWHARRAGVDTGAMVLEDFLPLVQRETGYAGKIAFLGWSMGGYGSLLLASQLGPRRVAAVVAESAALWTTPGLSAPGAFDDAQDFEAHDVFAPRRTMVLRQLPVRLDCGRSDPFASADQALAKALPTATFTLDHGAHTADYWKSHGAVQLQWLRQQFDRH